MTEQQTPPAADENQLIAERRAKLKALREKGVAFPNDFKRADYAGELQAEYADKERWTAEALEALDRHVQIAGRMLLKRVMGKASFVQIQDMSGRIQLYLTANDLVGLVAYLRFVANYSDAIGNVIRIPADSGDYLMATQQFLMASDPCRLLVDVPDCGHMCTMERPEAVGRALLQWLD